MEENNEVGAFYNAMPIGILGKYAENSGLRFAPELYMDSIIKVIYKSKSIIEIGAGEGRVIDGLLRLGYQGNIIGVERSQKHYDLLKRNYRHNPKIEICRKDILVDDLPKADLGFFLWAEICNLNEKQQIGIIEKLSRNVDTLILDSLIVGEDSNATSYDGNKLIIDMDFGRLEGLIPSADEILEYSKPYFGGFQTWTYHTENSKKRRIFMLEK